MRPFGIDETVHAFLLEHREEWLTTVMRLVTNVGSSLVIIPLLVVAVVWATRRRERQQVWLLIAAYAGSVGLYNAIKVLTARPRPPVGQAVASFSGYAFPSGHSTQTVAVYGMLAALVAASTTRRRTKTLAWCGAIFLSLVVGFSRLYLGVHWFTDVLGGYVLGVVWLLSLFAASRRWEAFRVARRERGSVLRPPGPDASR